MNGSRTCSGARAASLALAVGACAITLALPTAAAAAPTWLAPQALSVPGQGAVEPAAAAAPDGSAVVVWVRYDGPTRIVEAFHRPASGSFGAPQVLASGEFADSPHVAMDGQGNAVAAWLREDGSRYKVEASFRPAGGSFEAPQVLSPPENGVNPQVDVGAQGDAVVVWEQHNGVPRIEAAVRPAGGAFGSPQVLSGAGKGASAPQVAVNSRGDAVVAWKRFDGAGYQIEASFRPAGGSFGAPQELIPPGAVPENPRVGIDDQGGAIVAWERSDGFTAIEAAVRAPGGPFGAPQALSSPGQHALQPEVAVDPHGNAVVSWTRNDGSHWRIEAAFKPAGGPFGAPQVLSAPGADAGNARVAIGSRGDAVAVWQRHDGSEYSIDAAFRPAGGAFGAPQQISPHGRDAELPSVAAYPEGDAIAAWMAIDGSSYRLEAAGFDAAGPQLRNLSIPATAERGEPASFSVSPFDVWSPVAATSWAFGDGHSAHGTSVHHVFHRLGTHHVTVTSTDAVGNSSTATGTVLVRDTIKPRISNLRVTPSVVRVAGKSARKGARGSAAPKRGKKGAKAPKAKIRFRLSEPAQVTFTVKRQVRKRCGKRRCLKLVAVKGKLTAQGREGANAVPFTGRVGGRKLAPGRYVLTGQATDAAGLTSKPAQTSFRLVG